MVPTQSNDVSILAEFEKVMKISGWIRSTEVTVGIISEWKPDAVFRREDGRITLVELEQEVNVPRFLVRIRDDSRNSFDGARIVVLARKNTPINIETARMGIENEISVYAGPIDQRLVLDSELPKKMQPLKPEEFQAISARFRSNKRIPEAITRELRSLQNLEYAGDLRQFAHDYEAVNFKAREDEHQFVHDFVADRFSRKYAGTTFLEGLNLMSLLEDLSQVVLAKREHFLHSFQTFLLGSIVIDKYYAQFNHWYSECFDPAGTAKIDLPWFFTSLFHDVGNVTVSIGRISTLRSMINTVPRDMTSMYGPSLLGCLFEATRHGPVRKDWSPSSTSEERVLAPLLANRRIRDHGVIGAINLLSCASDVERDALASVIWPSSLAIAVHSWELWPQLVEKALFPVKAKNFPLVFLLQLCDNLQEWGREPYKPENSDLSSALIGISFLKTSVTCDIWVRDKSIAAVISNRNQWIMRELFETEDFWLECRFFYGGNN